MTIYITNSNPNSLYSGTEGNPFPCGMFQVTSLSHIREVFFKNTVISAVGHQSTADLYSESIGSPVSVNRMQVIPQPGDIVIAGLFTPPRRLVDGESWTIEEIESMPINWLMIKFLPWLPQEDNYGDSYDV